MVHAKTQEEHDSILEKAFKIAAENNVKFNSSKCKFSVSEVKYLGHIISAEGLKPDPSKVTAIKNMEIPLNKQDLQRFLGMITYISKFVPHFSLHLYASCLKKIIYFNGPKVIQFF